MLITEYRLDLVILALRAILPLEHPADTTLRYFFKNERIGSNERELEPVLKRDEKDWLASVKGVKVEDLSLSIQAELPEWLIEQMRASYSDEDILTLGLSMQQ